MSRWMLGVFAALSLWAAPAAPLQAQTQAQIFCGVRAEIIESLETRYGERRQALGLSQDGGLLEVLVSASGGWTILITYPERPTCIVATGEGWEIPVTLAGQPV